ncbi:unnamed protein product [Allacma fusca]|uniref:Single domain-containing protein n=1 Tax=Allacma fusca TaxID=39272 RepID=A0A8J2P2W8_9HEXA|nr:unnamed protein product [Allacma fusca]
MNSIFLSGIIVLCFVSTTLAALALGPAQVHASQPDHCYQESTKKFFKPGESWTEEGCMEASCLMVNYTGIPRLMISYATCGVVGVEPPCYLTENKAAAYPDCCPEPVCPDSSEETTEEQHKTTPSEEDTYHHGDFENEIPKDRPHFTNDIFRTNPNPWDDDYWYNYQDHMDNNVDDLQYLDYYPNERSSSPRFTRQDFSIDNFRWF